MDFSLFDLLFVFIQLDLSVSRLHDVSKVVDPSEFDSFYKDLDSLYHSVSSICDKYSKK